MPIINEAKKSIDKAIFGRQFFFDGYSDGESFIQTSHQLKGMKMVKYLNELSNKYPIDYIYYADDSYFNIKTAKKFLDSLYEYDIIQPEGETEPLENVNNQIQDIINVDEKTKY